MFDFFIKNGTIIDGTGTQATEKNIGITADKISYIGLDNLKSKKIIQAQGLTISPGFIDTHSHSEFTLLADNRAEGKISQGITTEINGNCGLSAAPLYGEAREHRENDLKELGIKERWKDFKEYFDILNKKQLSINFTTLCGQGNIRASVIGFNPSSPSESELTKMQELLWVSMAQGAKGLSTGLVYPPGIYSSTKEIINLLKIIGKKGIYTSHIRSEDDKLLETVKEIISIADKSGIKAHISHIKTSGKENWSKIDKVIELLNSAIKRGIKITCDRYPYIASSTDLDLILPQWVYDGGIKKEIERLKNKTTRKKIRNEILSINIDWQNIYISSTIFNNKWIEGKNISYIAKILNKDPVDIALDIIMNDDGRTNAIFSLMNEDNLKKFLMLDYLMIGTDSSARSFSGITCSGKPHPRSFGTFPRVIGKYIRDEKVLNLPAAIKKITHLPAKTFRLQKRGLIKEGYYCDLTIFDYDQIKDTATFESPYQKSLGIKYVFVNGIMAFKNGSITKNKAGKIL